MVELRVFSTVVGWIISHIHPSFTRLNLNVFVTIFFNKIYLTICETKIILNILKETKYIKKQTHQSELDYFIKTKYYNVI